MNRARFSGHVWRAVALISSALAIALTALSQPAARPARAPARACATAADRAAPGLEVPSSLAGVSERSEASTNGALASLIAIAEHGAPRVASAALQAIVQLGGDRARAYLARRFTDGMDSELDELAQALAELGGPESQVILFDAAHSGRAATREAARAAIAGLDTANARSFMLGELAGPDTTQAIAYFTDCQDARAVPALEGIARDALADSRRAAIAALFAQGEPAQGAVERLLRGEDEVSNDVLEVPAPSARLRLAQRETCIARLRAGAVTSGHVFDFLARDPSAEARQALVSSAHDPACVDSAVAALATRGDAASLGALSQLATDSDPGLASRATCALLEAPDSRTRPFVLRAQRTLPSEAAAALLRIGAPEANAALARMLSSNVASERLDAERLENDYDLGS